MSKPKNRQASGAAKNAPRSSPSATSSSTPKFYDGPTVRRSADKTEPGKKATAAEPVLVKPATAPSALAVSASNKSSKRRKCSLFSLVTFLPILLFCSLFSTVLCPPPSTQPSSFARATLNSLGLGKSQPHHTLHETLCYPANVYRETVLEPYVYPALADVEAKIHSHPAYKEHVEPRIDHAKATALHVWNGPVKPVVTRISRGANKFYFAHIQPHLPYIRAKVAEATAPATVRIKALYDQYAAEHVKTARKHACALVKQAKATYRDVVAHPLTAQAGKHSHTAFRLTKEHTHKAYVFSKPHAIKAWDFSVHHGRHTVAPRLVLMAQIAINDVKRVYGLIAGEINKLYQTHAAEHVDPYLNKARVAIAPYQAAFNDKVYQPHIKPLIVAILPATVAPQKTFWGFVADWVPSSATHADERGQHLFREEKPTKEQLKEVKKEPQAKKPKADKKETKPKTKEPKVEVKQEPKIEAPKVQKPLVVETDEKPKVEEPKAETKVETPKAETKVEEPTAAEAKTTTQPPSPSAPAAPTSEEARDHLGEVLAELHDLQKKLSFQTKAGYGRVQEEIVKESEYFLQLLPEMANIGTENLDREMKRMVTGLDRLYTNSKTLTRGQVAESIQMSANKVETQKTTARTGIQTRQSQLKDKFQPAIAAAQKKLDQFIGAEYEALGKRMSLVDGVSRKDWDAYKGIKKDVDSWKLKYAEAAEKPTTKTLKDAQYAIQVKVNEILVSFDDLFASFRDTQNNLKKLALERIAAREAVQGEAPRAAGKKNTASKAGSADNGRVSIQPVPEEQTGGNNVGDGAPVIGKDKAQVQEALKKAQAVSDEDRAKVTHRPEL